MFNSLFKAVAVGLRETEEEPKEAPEQSAEPQPEEPKQPEPPAPEEPKKEEPQAEPEPSDEEIANSLNNAEVVALSKAEDQKTIDKIAASGNYVLWTEPGNDDTVYASKLEVWTRKFLGEAKVMEASQAAVKRGVELLLQTTPTGAVTKNVKTGSSVDFTTNCRFRKEGHPCPYCYVEIGRNKTASFVQSLFASGWSLDDIKKSISTGKYAKSAQLSTATKKRGEEFGGGPKQRKGVYDNAPYNGDFIKYSKEQVAKENAKGGVRLYSNSDYGSTKNGVEWEDEQLSKLFDDADKVGLKVKAITKNPEFVKKWSNRTSVTDLSIDSLAKYGVPTNAMSIDQARELVANYPKAKIRVVAFNPEEAVEYAKDPKIGVITLFHGSPNALPKEMTSKMNVVDMAHGTKANDEVKKAVGPMIWQHKFCATGETFNCATCQAKCGFKAMAGQN